MSQGIGRKGRGTGSDDIAHLTRSYKSLPGVIIVEGAVSA